MSNLAATYFELGRHADALAMGEQVLEFRRRVLPANHPSIGEGCALRDGLHAVCRSSCFFLRIVIAQHQFQLRDERFVASRAGVRA